MLPLLAIIFYQGQVLGIEVETHAVPWHYPHPDGALYLGVCFAPWELEVDYTQWATQPIFKIPPHVAAQFWNGYRPTRFAESMLPEAKQTKMIVGHA